MDPYLHTAISVSLLYIAYKIGKYFGYRDGIIDVWASLVSVLKVKKMILNEKEELIVTYENGKQGKLKVEDCL